MAKKVKKAIRKPKKRSGSKKRKSGNIFTKLIVIIFALILAFFLIFNVFRPSNKTAKVENTKVEQKVKTGTDKKAVSKEEKKNDKKIDKKEDIKAEKKAEQTKIVEKSITGTWMSTTGGAVLTMGDKKYRLDFMGVDSDAAIIGTYSVDGDRITFKNTSDPCKGIEGVYDVRFEKQEISFKCKSDDCTKRKATLPTEWTWLDTED